jgi:hypothetical protein
MTEQVKRIPINYTDSDIELKLINGGNINMEEDDFVFEGSGAHTYTKSPIGIQKAIDELKKNINNLDYLNKE